MIDGREIDESRPCESQFNEGHADGGPLRLIGVK